MNATFIIKFKQWLQIVTAEYTLCLLFFYNSTAVYVSHICVYYVE